MLVTSLFFNGGIRPICDKKDPCTHYPSEKKYKSTQAQFIEMKSV